MKLVYNHEPLLQDRPWWPLIYSHYVIITFK